MNKYIRYTKKCSEKSDLCFRRRKTSNDMEIDSIFKIIDIQPRDHLLGRQARLKSETQKHRQDTFRRKAKRKSFAWRARVNAKTFDTICPDSTLQQILATLSILDDQHKAETAYYIKQYLSCFFANAIRGRGKGEMYLWCKNRKGFYGRDMFRLIRDQIIPEFFGWISIVKSYWNKEEGGFCYGMKVDNLPFGLTTNKKRKSLITYQHDRLSKRDRIKSGQDEIDRVRWIGKKKEWKKSRVYLQSTHGGTIIKDFLLGTDLNFHKKECSAREVENWVRHNITYGNRKRFIALVRQKLRKKITHYPIRSGIWGKRYGYQLRDLVRLAKKMGVLSDIIKK